LQPQSPRNIEVCPNLWYERAIAKTTFNLVIPPESFPVITMPST